MVDALQQLIEEQPAKIRAMYLLRYASADPSAEYRTNVARAHEAQRRDVQRWIEAGQKKGTVPTALDAELSAELFCSTVDGLIYRWLANSETPISHLHSLLKRHVTWLLQA